MTAPADGLTPSMPSLRRRGPAKIEVTDQYGRAPRIARGAIHIRAGRKLRVKIVPQVAGPGARPAKGDIKSSPSLRPEDGPRPIKEGAVEACQADFVARFPFQFPLPRKAEICASVAVDGHEPFKVIIPVVIWPSILSVLAWVLGGVLLAILSARYVESMRTRSPIDAARHVGGDLSFLYEAALIGFSVTLGVQVLGLITVWLGFMPGDGE
jgi:hypothetical protein